MNETLRGGEQPDPTLNKDKQVPFATDLKHAIAQGERRSVQESGWYFTSADKGVAISVSASSTSLLHMDNSDTIFRPEGTVVGLLDFCPEGMTNLRKENTHNIA